MPDLPLKTADRPRRSHRPRERMPFSPMFWRNSFRRRNQPLSRRITVALALLWALHSPTFAAAPYPDKPVRIVVPEAMGARPDRIARLVAPGLAGQFGQQFLVDNRSGAHGTLGSELVARSTPDGYTLLIGMPGTLTTTRHPGPKRSYDARKDFAPIGRISLAPYVLTAHPSLPAKTVGDIVRYAKSRPGRLTYGSNGRDLTAQLAMAMLKRMTRIDIKRASHGSASELPDGLLEGRVSVSMLPVGESMDHIRSGRLLPLGVTSRRRSLQLPEVPTLHESGLHGFEASTWIGLLAPARTPAHIQQRLSEALLRVVSSTDMRRHLLLESMEPASGNAASFAELLGREIESYRRFSRAPAIRLP